MLEYNVVVKVVNQDNNAKVCGKYLYNRHLNREDIVALLNLCLAHQDVERAEQGYIKIYNVHRANGVVVENEIYNHFPGYLPREEVDVKDMTPAQYMYHVAGTLD